MCVGFVTQHSAIVGRSTCPSVGMTSKHTETLALPNASVPGSCPKESAKFAGQVLEVRQFAYRPVLLGIKIKFVCSFARKLDLEHGFFSLHRCCSLLLTGVG